MRTPSVTIETAIKKINSFYRKTRRVPTYEEMAKFFRFASKRSAFLIVERLIEAGLMEKDSKGRLTLRRTFLPLPVLSSIPAGSPVDAQEQRIETLSDEGIKDGDLVVVDKRREVKVNDIVAAGIVIHRTQDRKPLYPWDLINS